MTRDHSSFPEAVLLDLDGTLVASRDGIIASLRAALRDLGREPDPAEILDWVVGPPLPDIMRRMVGDDAMQIEAAMIAYRRHYDPEGMRRSPLFAGIREFMDQLAASGRRVFLATSKPLHLAQRIIEMVGLTAYFDGLYGARPDDKGAEKPELIAGIVAVERIDPDRAVMVGDRCFDITGAHANGLRAVGVTWGYGGRAELEQAGADAIAETPERLFAVIEHQLKASSAHLS